MKYLEGVQILSNSELMNVDGGQNLPVESGCCLHQLWMTTIYYSSTCGVIVESADYAYRIKPASNKNCGCHVTC